MKIAYLVNKYPAPSHAWIRREIHALGEQGLEVDRFSVRPADGLVDPDDLAERERTRSILGRNLLVLLALGGWTALRRPVRFARALAATWRLGRRSDRGLARHFAYLIEACQLLRWTAAAGTRHLHAHFGTNSAAVAYLCRLLGGPPYSFTIHGPDEFDRLTVLGLAEKIAAARFVVAISKFCRSQIYRACKHEHWSKVEIVHCTVDDDFLDTPAQPIDNSNRFVSVGRLSEQKGQHLLLQAAARLVERGREFEIHIIGDGEMRGDLERRIEELGLAQHVKLLGTRSGAEVRETILASRAMLLPSFAEGLPVVLMEALALRRPAITTRVAGIPELVEDGVNGWLISPGDIDELVAAMEDALDTPVDRLAELGEAGHEAVSQEHRARTEAARLAACIRGRQSATRHESSVDRVELKPVES